VRKTQLLGAFVGVPDQMLRSIGLIVVVAAKLDHQRMELLEQAAGVPVPTSSKYWRSQLTDAIRASFANPPFDRLQDRVHAWLADADNLFDIRDTVSHSTGYYVVRGDGSSGFYSHRPSTGNTRPQFTAGKLEEFVLRFVDALHEGAGLTMEAGIINEGGLEAHDEFLSRRAAFGQVWEDILTAAADGNDGSGRNDA
jgi:hypothetical protein